MLIQLATVTATLPNDDTISTEHKLFLRCCLYSNNLGLLSTLYRYL